MDGGKRLCVLSSLLVLACLVGGCYYGDEDHHGYGHHHGGWYHGYRHHEIGYLVFFDSAPTGAPQEARARGGVFVNYTLGEPNEPNFTWASRQGRFYVNDQPVPWEDGFVLYVNDSQGRARKIVLAPDAARDLCTRIEDAESEAVLDDLWRQHVQSQLQPSGGL